jgi:monofunctional biosynthetic peptidoglycan transglycosylase
MRRRLVAITLAGLTLAALLAWVLLGLPSRATVRALAQQNPGKTRLLLQREAEATAKQHRPRSVRVWVPLSHVSRHLIHAVLSAEDQNFFGHEGVDWDAIQKSLEKDVEKRRFARGGSTITQQLAKNLYFGPKTPPQARELVSRSGWRRTSRRPASSLSTST